VAAGSQEDVEIRGAHVPPPADLLDPDARHEVLGLTPADSALRLDLLLR
jgi:hypothetical protein